VIDQSRVNDQSRVSDRRAGGLWPRRPIGFPATALSMIGFLELELSLQVANSG
jgi:hypothetical protein